MEGVWEGVSPFPEKTPIESDQCINDWKPLSKSVPRLLVFPLSPNAAISVGAQNEFLHSLFSPHPTRLRSTTAVCWIKDLFPRLSADSCHSKSEEITVSCYRAQAGTLSHRSRHRYAAYIYTAASTQILYLFIYRISQVEVSAATSVNAACSQAFVQRSDQDLESEQFTDFH